jgi:hypothetical protein
MKHDAPMRATRQRVRLAPLALAISGLALAACGSATTTTKVGSQDSASTAATAKSTVTTTTTTTAGATAQSATTGAATTAATAAPAAAPVAVPPTLDFTAPLVGGGTFDAKQYAGKKVAFWFWAPT